MEPLFWVELLLVEGVEHIVGVAGALAGNLRRDARGVALSACHVLLRLGHIFWPRAFSSTMSRMRSALQVICNLRLASCELLQHLVLGAVKVVASDQRIVSNWEDRRPSTRVAERDVSSKRLQLHNRRC